MSAALLAVSVHAGAKAVGAIAPPVVPHISHSHQVLAMLRQLPGVVIDWVSDYWLQILIAGVAGAAIVAALVMLRRVGAKLANPQAGPSSWLSVLGQVVARTTSLFIVMVAIRTVGNMADMPPVIERPLYFCFTLASVIQGAIWAREFIIGTIEHRTSADHFQGETIINAMGLIRLLINVVVFAIAAVVLLDNLGVNVTGLVAGFGVGGIAIGLAAQGIFADLFAALAIIFDGPFGKGDTISYDNTTGTIEAIGLKSTRVRSITGELRVIANKHLLDKEILNLTAREHIRLPFTLGIALETSPALLARIPAIVTELVEAEGASAARAGFDGFGPSALQFALLVDVPGRDWSIANPLRDRLIVAILSRFAAEGIVMPYPAQTTFTGAPDGRLVPPYPES